MCLSWLHYNNVPFWQILDKIYKLWPKGAKCQQMKLTIELKNLIYKSFSLCTSDGAVLFDLWNSLRCVISDSGGIMNRLCWTDFKLPLYTKIMIYKIRKQLLFLYTSGLLFRKIYFRFLYNPNFTISFIFALTHRAETLTRYSQTVTSHGRNTK